MTVLRARAKITWQNRLTMNPIGDLTNAQFPMLNSHPKWMSDCQMFHRFRMRIEHWELNIGQILPSPLSAKLFLRGPLAIPNYWAKPLPGANGAFRNARLRGLPS